MTTIKFDNSYAKLPAVFYAPQALSPTPDPKLIKLNEGLATEMGLDADYLKSAAGIALLSGGDAPNSATPIAMAYAGHQFGGWSPQLGDGRAVLLGEVITPDGARLDLHLKGSGRTKYSRGGDGKAGIGPVLREYILSEAMYALGVPTTRTLGAVTTGEDVFRQHSEAGAVLARVAQSHIRVGTFQYFYARNDAVSLKVLADYVIDRHYPEARKADNPVREMFVQIAKRQAQLIAAWMGFGFIHGVMNTDNVQVAGETIDYGPCAFMDTFDPMKVFSSIDRDGRYAWGRQPQIGHWNLTRLAEALQPIWGVDDDTSMAEIEADLGVYSTTINTAVSEIFAQKLGLDTASEQNATFMNTTFEIMAKQEIDFTLFFSNLARLEQAENAKTFNALFKDATVAENWLGDWNAARDTSGISDTDSTAMMASANPIYIARNHQVEAALQAASAGDLAPFETLIEVLKSPFMEQAKYAAFEAAPTPAQEVTQTFCGT